MPEPFADLPDALVRDLLEVAVPVAVEVQKRFESLRNSRAEYRRAALDRRLIKRKADLEVPREPSVSGIDGSYQLHRLTSLDLCATAAVAIEGTSKEAIRYWPEPYHRIWAGAVPHAEGTTLVLRGLMVGMELELASIAPHDLVLLDGALGSLVIYLNQGLSNIIEVPMQLGDELRQRWQGQQIFTRLMALIRSDRVVAVPKFTSKNELVKPMGLNTTDAIDGRTLATLILEPGEYSTPLPVYEEDFHLPPGFYSEQDHVDMNRALKAVRVVYYRPFGWVPSVRIEMPGPIANSSTRLSIALEGISRQFFSPAVMEPYPLFLADRMVKSLGAGVSVIEQAVSQQVADRGLDLELTMLLLQNYRTEGGRGGV